MTVVGVSGSLVVEFLMTKEELCLLLLCNGHTEMVLSKDFRQISFHMTNMQVLFAITENKLILEGEVLPWASRTPDANTLFKK